MLSERDTQQEERHTKSEGLKAMKTNYTNALLLHTQEPHATDNKNKKRLLHRKRTKNEQYYNTRNQSIELSPFKNSSTSEPPKLPIQFANVNLGNQW